MGVIREAVEEAAHLLVDQRVVRDVGDPRVQLLARWEVAVDQEVRHLEEAAPFRELLDGIAAVAEDASLAVKEGDGRQARAGVHVPVVHRDEPRLGPEPADVDRLLALGSADDRQLGGVALVGEAGTAAVVPAAATGGRPSFDLGVAGQRRPLAHGIRSFTASRSSRSSSRLRSILACAHGACPMPCTIWTSLGAVARSG